MMTLDVLSLVLKVLLALGVLMVALVVGVTWGAAVLDRDVHHEEKQWTEE